MSRLAALTAFGAALGLHLAVFAALPPTADQAALQAAGEDGDSLISLAPADLSALIAEWEAPPDLPPLPQPLPPPVLEAAVQAPTQTPAPETAPPIAAVQLPSPDTAPVADTAPEPPKPVEKPKTVEKPKAKPEPQAKAKPAEPKPQSPAAPAQKAAGKGGAATAGEGGKDATASLSKAQAKKLTATWGASIRARIERKKSYPAKANGAAGKVVLRLVVGADGGLRGVSVAKSSGNAALDAAAVAAVKKAGRFGAAPSGLGETSFTLPITFQP